jgi:hypothetical protein
LNGKTVEFSSEDIENIFSSRNQEFQPYISKLRGRVNIEDFLQHFTFVFAQPFDGLVKDVYEAFTKNNFSDTDIEALIYPNAIQEIANLSIKHDVDERIITKPLLLERLRTIKTTAVSKWTLALKSRGKVLLARRNQLKHNLSKNSRLRYFIFFKDSFRIWIPISYSLLLIILENTIINRIIYVLHYYV